jgi:hypothetical protein
LSYRVSRRTESFFRWYVRNWCRSGEMPQVPACLALEPGRGTAGVEDGTFTTFLLSHFGQRKTRRSEKLESFGFGMGGRTAASYRHGRARSRRGPSAFLSAVRAGSVRGTTGGSTPGEFRGQFVGQILCLCGDTPQLFGKGVQAPDSNIVVLHERHLTPRS